MPYITSQPDIPFLISQLTLDEKIDLLAGKNFWETLDIPRLNIPSIKVTDGPNGARGAEAHKGTRAAAFPACTSLAATFDPSLATQMGAALAEETVTKGSHLLLGPTVCLHRHPLGGRNFEAFGEDPFLAGRLAGCYIRGLQEKGVGAAIKHFAANEQETERFSVDVRVSEKALREIYLKSFEIAIKEGKPWAVMTSYNKINGVHNDMNDFLLQKVLREQWGFNGLVVSDWGGVNSVAESIKAGLTLEMPGPARIRKPERVKAALKDGSLDESDIDARVEELLRLLVAAGKFDNPTIEPEQAIDTPEQRALIRNIGAQGIVLLKNEDNVLPLQSNRQQTIGLLGQSKECFAHGGGGAMVNAHYKITPWDAFQSTVGPNTTLKHSKGAHMFRTLPPLEANLFNLSNDPGATMKRFKSTPKGHELLSETTIPDTHFSAMMDTCDALHIDATYRPTESGLHYLEFISTGPAKLYINDVEVMIIKDKLADQMAFILGGANGEVKQYEFESGEEYRIHIETRTPEIRPGRFALLEGVIGISLGFMLQEAYEENLLDEAVEVAKTVDTAVVFVGRSKHWETEGCDHQDMTLPARGSQDRLIEAVAEVNPNTIVVVSTGTPIQMPWLGKVKAVLQTWFAGQELGNSVADVMFGRVCPGGKLPCTFPISEEATPAYGNFPGDMDALEVKYEEGSFIGYRHYYHHPEQVLFPFGYGLSYTTFNITYISFESSGDGTEQHYSITAKVENTGSMIGTEVVQVYIVPPAKEPVQRKLVGFGKVEIEPGMSDTVKIDWELERFMEFDEAVGKWVVIAGKYEVQIATSAAAGDIQGHAEFDIGRNIWAEV